MSLLHSHEHLPNLMAIAINEDFALDLCVTADTLFSGEEVDPAVVLTGLLMEQRSEPVVHTVLGILARLLDRLGRCEGDLSQNAKITAEMVMGTVWSSESTRATELLLVVLDDGDLTPGEAERGRHQAGTDLLILTQLTLGLASMVGITEGNEPSAVLREISKC